MDFTGIMARSREMSSQGKGFKVGDRVRIIDVDHEHSLSPNMLNAAGTVTADNYNGDKDLVHVKWDNPDYGNGRIYLIGRFELLTKEEKDKKKTRLELLIL